jgi:uncharacterized protein (TIGR02001 family)
MVALVCPVVAEASGLSGVATIASEYIYRGQAVSAHHPALSLGLDYEHDSGVFGGLWASTIDLESPAGTRDIELDYYLGYYFEPGESLSLSALVLRYTYPGQPGPIDYEHTELQLSATFLDRYTLEFAYSDDMYGLGEPGRHFELRGQWPVATYWVLGAGVGLNDPNVLNTPSYLHWDAGVSARYSRLTMDLRWYDNEDIVGAFQRWSAGSRLVLSLSVAY